MQTNQSNFGIQNYTKNLIKENGIFFSKHKNEIFYPEEGNDFCFKLENNSFWFKHRNNCIVEIVKKYAPDKIFFDVGGGNGFTAKCLEDNGITTCLIEPGLHGCLNAKTRGLSNIICSTLETASFKTNSLPAIGLFDVIEHIENDDAFLNMINMHCQNDGFVFITIPAYRFLWSKEDKDAGHFRRYTLHSIKNKLTKSGFETVYSTYIFSFLVFPILLFRTIPSILGLAKTGQKKSEKEHTVANIRGGGGKSLINSALSFIFALEINRIRKKKRIPFGGSCLIVAKKSNLSVR